MFVNGNIFPFNENPDGNFYELVVEQEYLTQKVFTDTKAVLGATRNSARWARVVVWHDEYLNDVDDVLANAVVLGVYGDMATFHKNWEAVACPPAKTFA